MAGLSPFVSKLASALSPSGPEVARAVHRGLALVFFVAFASLGVQVRLLIGSRGLSPFEPVASAAQARGAPFLDLPTAFRWFPSDAHLELGIGAGLVLSLVAFAGIRPRTCFAVLTALYLSFTIACGTFLAFQWDNLLVECGFLATFLPRDRPAAIVHVLFRLLLFKLYFESGVAKAQSHLGDWQDGSAMTKYYETAPLPTWLAWYAHHLPEAWHRFESRATLAWELALPFAFFLSRPARLAAAALATAFQLVNIATANYGFFSYLACVLHLVLLEDRDLAAARSFLRRCWRRIVPALERWQFRPRLAAARWRLGRSRFRAWRERVNGPALPASVRAPFTRLPAVLLPGLAAVLVLQSVAEGLARFTPRTKERTLLSGARDAIIEARDATALGREVSDALRRLRLVNNYHLFGHITRERPEVEVQTSAAASGDDWTPHALHYKPGPVERAPPFVAPHQPRVDFRLWFTALGWQRGVERWVTTLLERACQDPGAVEALFAERLPRDTARARLVVWDYAFTSPDERRATGNVWKRTQLAVAAEMGCKRP